jgi:Domain of unknown function (DUF2341)
MPWSGRAPVALAPATPLAGQQVLVRFNPSALGGIKADGSDVRFTLLSSDDPATQALSHWFESYAPTAARAWVKVPSAGTSTLQLRYGNPSAVAVSSISQTMRVGFNYLYGVIPAGWPNQP